MSPLKVTTKRQREVLERISKGETVILQASSFCRLGVDRIRRRTLTPLFTLGFLVGPPPKQTAWGAYDFKLTAAGKEHLEQDRA